MNIDGETYAIKEEEDLERESSDFRERRESFLNMENGNEVKW